MLQIYFIFLVGSISGIFVHKHDHAFYLSVAEVVHEKNKTVAQIKIKVFTNDIEDALFNESNQRMKLSELTTFELYKNDIQAYFADHFEVSINSKKQTIILSHAELTGDAVWFYFNMSCTDSWNEVSVKADYLMELFPTQSNVISIEHESKKQFIRLTTSKKYDTVKF
ncbi:MAG TPA: DUF6702 family protein [Cyclobacteriaceae bacterium]